MASPRRLPRLFFRSVFLSNLILVCASILTFILLIQPWSLRQASLPLKVGDVAQQDLRAPRDIQYVSNVLTEDARNAAERAVDPIYAPPDPTVARGQLEKLNSVLVAITIIRTDNTTPADQKTASVAAIPGISLQPSSIQTLLDLTDLRWQVVQNEAVNVLEKLMQAPIRSADLVTLRQSLSSQVSFMMTDAEASAIVDLVSPFLAANSFYSPELTDAARQAAQAAVQPVTQSYVQDQTIVSRGEIITPENFEALTVLGLVHSSPSTYSYLGAIGLVVLSAAFIAMYFHRRQQQRTALDLRSLSLLAILFLVFIAGVRIVTPNRAVLPYLFPVPAFGLLVAGLFGLEDGVVFSLLLGFLSAYGMPDTLELMPYYILGTLCGILALGQARRIGQYLYAAGAIACAGVAVVVAYRLPFTDIDWIGMATLIGAALLNGIASTGIAVLGQYLLAQFLGMTTALQLLEISRPDYPLLKYFLQRAPGTYQHSLQVANLAEQAAEHIQADALQTRVGALFHDIGKAVNPLFFIENQPPSQTDSHTDLSPEVAAATIIRHIPDGLELARKHRLPHRIHDFISEHQGTMLTRYQYTQAVQAAGGDASQVDEAKFRYPGPTPRSKETALLMFADGVEATARAEHPATDEEVRKLVRNVIDRCRKDGQLEEAPLSQKDIADITESFVTTLRVTYHPRLEYPQDQSRTSTPETVNQAALPPSVSK